MRKIDVNLVVMHHHDHVLVRFFIPSCYRPHMPVFPEDVVFFVGFRFLPLVTFGFDFPFGIDVSGM